jgi:ABC-type bacteriocin/lantibiotic exporter with double-glycine peptidase domain
MNTSIQNLDLTNNFLRRLENKLILMLKSNFKTEHTLNGIELSKNIIYEIGIFLVTTFGIYLVYKNELNILSLFTFNSLLYYLVNPIKEILAFIPKIEYLKSSYQKLQDFINIPTLKDNVGINSLSNNNIEFQNVTYSYNAYQNILENVNFKIEPNEKVLLIGPSGSGKSTICKLLNENNLKFKGMIKLNETSEKDYSLNAIRKNITYVGQNEKLFSGTIKENIICDRNIDDKKFLEICKICKLEEIIEKRPNRYQTFINASLNNLSGGEKQRIILARALLKNSKILILDEALSEVNIEMEKEIINNIKEYFENQTLIYVSHKNVQSEFKKIINIGEFNVRNI